MVRYHPPISDAGVSVGFTGGNFLGARCKDHAGLEPGASNGSASPGQWFQPHGWASLPAAHDVSWGWVCHLEGAVGCGKIWWPLWWLVLSRRSFFCSLWVVGGLIDAFQMQVDLCWILVWLFPFSLSGTPPSWGYLTIDQICRMGQKYCDSPMKSDHFGRGDHGHGWESNKSLLENRFIERDKAGKAWSTNFRGPKDRIRLTEVQLTAVLFGKKTWLIHGCA